MSASGWTLVAPAVSTAVNIRTQANVATTAFNDLVAVCEPSGKVSNSGNPNGAKNHIAGIFNAKRNVLGLMPHPEVMCDPMLGCNDARRLFDGMVESVA